jgi:hypothetical protein
VEKTFADSLLESLDEKTVSGLSEVFVEESRRGLNDASARLLQTRTDLFNKVRELGGELEKRRPPVTTSGEGQRQVALNLIVHLATNLKTVLDSPNSVDEKMTEVRRICTGFERQLAKVLEACAVLEESAPIDVKAEPA